MAYHTGGGFRSDLDRRKSQQVSRFYSHYLSAAGCADMVLLRVPLAKGLLGERGPLGDSGLPSGRGAVHASGKQRDSPQN